jgi:hypothetical protein
MAKDFQLFATSFFAIRWMYNSPKRGVPFALFVIAFSTVLQAFIMWRSDSELWLNFLQIDLLKVKEEFSLHYFYTLCNVATYYIGLVTGYLIANNLRMQSQTKITCGWIIAGISFVCYFSYFAFRVEGRSLSKWEGLAFAVLRKPIFSTFCGWFFYATYFENSGIYGWIVSRRFLLPLSRMFASINVVHMAWILYVFSISHHPMDYSTFSLYSRLITVIVFSVIFGYFFYILFEAPIVNITSGMGVKKLLIEAKLKDKAKISLRKEA